MFSAIILPQPCLQVVPDLYAAQKVSVAVLRLDELHPVISGNKWFKLKHYLHEATQTGKKGIITWGGAWSNHLVATAAACAAHGLQSIGIVRGEAPPQKTAALADCLSYGMQLIFVSRTTYKQALLPELLWGCEKDFVLVPEGGYGPLGVTGAAEIINNTGTDYSHIICAVGTGTMLAGICSAAAPGVQIMGISSQKNNVQLEEEVRQLLPPGKAISFSVQHQFHFGGYAKHNPALLQFMNNWWQQTGIPTDFVYTAKTFYAVDALVRQQYFGAGSNLLVIHSGGLQGNRGLPPQSLIFSP